MKLNDRQIKLISYPSKGRVSYPDGNSLYLRVTPIIKKYGVINIDKGEGCQDI